MLQPQKYFLTSALCFSAITVFAESDTTDGTTLVKSAAEYAADAKLSADSAKESEKVTKNISDSLAATEDGGFNFSVGIGYEAFNSPYIKEAVLRGAGTDKIVVVTDSYSANTSLWLTTNYVWDGLGSTWTHPGMYVGVRVAGEDSNVFDAFGVGVMWVLRRNGTTKDNTFKSLNIGIGAVWHRTQELAYGITEGSSLPASYTDIEYQKRDETSWMLMLSVGFN